MDDRVRAAVIILCVATAFMAGVVFGINYTEYTTITELLEKIIPRLRDGWNI